MNTSPIYTAQSLEFNNEYRIVLKNKSKSAKEFVLGYTFRFVNNGKPKDRFVPLQKLLDYTGQIMNGETYATCEAKIHNALERIYGNQKDKAPTDYFFFRFVDDILLDYWDEIEKELLKN